ncbi:putative NADH dehydrogenase 1 beta subcomplex subunit [Daphnia magna]|uniref:Putative NADH dehydrogenase 1 beta subcomplex subunit n=1 Tax=Daphnia magna TaxID=35525 RepID=A0A164T9G0_9CRUS|nr:putative NADH dehydrogenase 1 beta subcomplex subunit [Daphnia magna]
MSMLKELSMTWSFIRQKKHLVVIFPVVAYLIGWKLEKIEYERMTLFRDRSALFGREHGPDYKPSW